MSKAASGSTADLNYYELAKRVWAFWNQDHLLGTLLGLFIAVLVKWWGNPNIETLYIVFAVGGTLVGVTAVKFIAGYFGNNQQYKQLVADAQTAKDVAETHFKMEFLTKSGDQLLGLYTTLIQTLAEVFEDGKVTPDEVRAAMRSWAISPASSRSLAGSGI